MYPSAELEALERRKAIVSARIAGRRLQCVACGQRIAQPVAAVGRLVASWRRLTPIVRVAAVPVALLLMRWLRKRALGGPMSAVLTWLPLVLRGLRQGMRPPRTPAAARGNGAAV